MVDKTQTSRTVLIIGSALAASSLPGGSASAQSAPAAAPAGPPGFPSCMAKDCKLADGHPDFTGFYAASAGLTFGGAGGTVGSGLDFQNFAGRKGAFNFEHDNALYRESNVWRTGDPYEQNYPLYKPEFWDQIVDNNYNGNFLDPEQSCKPIAIPRVGPPTAIISTPGFATLLYADVRSFGIKTRIVPTDGRPHNTLRVAQESYSGDPVGHWEGDTLVVESVGFTDETWLHKNGYIHGFNMKVTEKFTRKGNQLVYETIVDDSEYLLEPWVMRAQTLNINPDPTAVIFEPLPCLELDIQQTTSHIRSG
jgi:hypothetical protein